MDHFVLGSVMTLAVAVGAILGLVLGSVFGAIILRLAATALDMPPIPFVAAFKSTLLSNLVVFVFNFLIGVNYGLTTRIFSQNLDRYQTFQPGLFPPIFWLYSAVFGLLVTAVIFCRTVPVGSDGARISYRDAVALAAVYLALTVACILILAILVSIVIVAVTQWFSPGR